MPTYTVYSAPGAFTADQEQRIARAITEAHAHATGAPRYYVQVIMGAGENCRRFVGGKPSQQQMWIRGDIRAGRTDEQLKELMMEIVQRTAKAAKMDEEDIWIDLNEIRPAAILKYRTVFPPAGQESLWYERLSDHLKEKIKTME